MDNTAKIPTLQEYNQLVEKADIILEKWILEYFQLMETDKNMKFETKWISINEYLAIRYIGSKLLARLIIKYNGKKVNPLLGNIFHLACKLTNTRLEYKFNYMTAICEK